MVEGYPVMDDYEEAQLVAEGRIFIDDCEDPERVAKILRANGMDEDGFPLPEKREPVYEYRPIYDDITYNEEPPSNPDLAKDIEDAINVIDEVKILNQCWHPEKVEEIIQLNSVKNEDVIEILENILTILCGEENIYIRKVEDTARSLLLNSIITREDFDKIIKHKRKIQENKKSRTKISITKAMKHEIGDTHVKHEIRHKRQNEKYNLSIKEIENMEDALKISENSKTIKQVKDKEKILNIIALNKLENKEYRNDYREMIEVIQNKKTIETCNDPIAVARLLYLNGIDDIDYFKRVCKNENKNMKNKETSICLVMIVILVIMIVI